jgi:hypothetical protein
MYGKKWSQSVLQAICSRRYRCCSHYRHQMALREPEYLTRLYGFGQSRLGLGCISLDNSLSNFSELGCNFVLRRMMRQFHGPSWGSGGTGRTFYGLHGIVIDIADFFVLWILMQFFCSIIEGVLRFLLSYRF